MTTNGLDDFFKTKKKKSGEDIDWDKKRDEWIKDIDALYKDIKKYMGTLLRDKTVSLSRSEKIIVEEYLGEYSVVELTLYVGDERVVFSPKGRNIVGASGRVDMIGEMGRKTLVVQPERRWSIVATRIPKLNVVPLDENTLLDALKEIMRP